VAGDIPALNVEILVQLSNLTAAVQEATTGLNKIGDSAKLQETKFSSLKSTMGGVFAGNLLTQGLGGLEEGLKGVIDAASQAQTTTVALATAMNNAKVNTEANRGAVEKSVASMENLAFTGNDARGAMMTLVTATGSVSKSTQLMSEAANLARAQHESLGDASETLAKALTGKLGGAFKEYGITLDTTLPKNEAITKALNELNDKIKNQASAYLETYAGKMDLLKTKMENAKETIGGALIPILTNLTSVFAGVLDVIKPILPELTILAVIIGTVIIAVKAWEMAQAALDIVLDANPIMLAVAAVIALIAVIVTAWNHSKTFRDIVVDVMKAVVEAIGWVIGALGELVTSFIKIESGPLKLFLGALSHLPFVGSGAKEALKMINEGTQDVGNFFDSAKEKIDKFANGLDSLKNAKISIGMSTPDLSEGGTGAASAVDVSGQAANGNIVKGVATKAEKALADRNAKIKTYNDQAVALEDQMNAVLADRQTKMDDATNAHNLAIANAQDNFNQTSLDIQTKFEDAKKTATDNYNTTVENLTTTHEQNVLNIQQQYADKALQLQQTAADDRAKIIQSSIDVMTNAFASATKIDLGKLFTAGGGSADALASQLKDQLAQITQLQQDAGKLAAAGYSQSFINEVISQGPTQGDALAQSVLTAAPATQDSIKSLYDQVQTASQDGLNDLAAQMNDGTNFATNALAEQYAAVGTTLTTQLAANSTAMQDAIDKETDTFNKAMDAALDTENKAVDAATNARDLALQVANQTLTDSLTAAQVAFNKSTQTISDATMKQLDALQIKLDATAASIQALNGSTASITGYQTSVLAPAGVSTNNSAGSFMNTQGYNAGQASVIGSLTQNVYTTDASLPSITTGTLNAITLGQTQGIIPAPNGGGKGMVAL
jgi:hypothetical protein